MTEELSWTISIMFDLRGTMPPGDWQGDRVRSVSGCVICPQVADLYGRCALAENKISLF